MAEAIELDFTVPQSVTKPAEPIVAKALREFSDAVVDQALSDDIPEAYRLNNYYNNDNLGKDVLHSKYLAPWEQHPWDLWKRLSAAIASVEKTKSKRNKWTEDFFSILEDFKFVPGGRIMHGAGRDDIKSTLNNCYVVAIKTDSIESIYQTINEEALTYKYGGGCGHDLSILRPAGDPINGTGGESCGPVGFMNLFSENTNTIAQHGRRGANMQTLRVDHPDIEAFIDIKRNNLDNIKYSNISVLITHEFMETVESNSEFDLRWNGKVYRTVDARKLWNRIISSAHSSAEPGIIFWDTMKEYHNAEYCSPLISTNPCAEQPLPDGGCCNLGSINLERFVDDQGNFMISDFKVTVAHATRFLDNVIDYNLDRHALPLQKDNAINDRRIGLGMLGLGDMLVKMGIKYDSEDALQTVDQVCQIFRDTAYDASINLGREKGIFPNFELEQYNKSKFIKTLPKSIRSDIADSGIRNATVLTLPPTGSGAIVARVTSGIEPIFSTSYTRRVKNNSGSGDQFNEYQVYHPIIEKLFGDDKILPDYVVCAHNIDPFFRVRMQGVIQKYIDSSISSTVNLASDTSVETVADIYHAAYQAGLKGITVYREGSREGILISDKKHSANQKTSATSKETGSLNTPQVSARPRHRPLITSGVTRRIRTGEGTLYITINEDEDGLCEVFTTIGKAGGHAAAQSEAISRLISLSLRSGIEPSAIVKQLKGISGPNPTWEDGQLILSTPDAIGKALDDYLKARKLKPEENLNTHPFAFVDKSIAKDFGETAAEENTIRNMAFNFEVCPKCSGNSLKSESGCVVCHDCGYSKCD
ncbi:MAG: adenosylcobalamin-dependent ribonucleoside-diphosphate reductase [Candidatus Marinimicrobia bacterium]|nr:adenosylcobalamin-dependent ribonucleoside-diphosphate reductase [Candidatus Neomarinimicrobiota bacterium]